jgi:uncharacterized protein (DUF302 family)
MEITQSAFGFRTRLDLPYDEAVEKITAALQEQGFGVLTEIDVRATLQEKLGESFRRYVILGACNPPLAHRALSAELDVGLMLPCNVVVWETDEGGSVVSMVDPETMVRGIDDPGLHEVASEARRKLETALQAIAP